MNLALITGGGSGIGLATAERFLEKGWSVALIGRDAAKFDKLISRHPEALGFSLDLSKPLRTQASWPEFEEKVLKNPHLSALINNAGIYQMSSFMETKEEDFIEQLQVNFLGAIRLLKEVWPQFLKRECAYVVNVTSTVALRPVAGTSAYAASKAALQSLTETLALEGAPSIRVNTLCPGIIETPIHKWSVSEEATKIRAALADIIPLGRVGRAEDVAKWAYRLCSEEASWMTGSLIKVDGGIHLASKG